MVVKGERDIIRGIMNKGGVKESPDDCSYTRIGDSYILSTTDSITPQNHIPAGVDPFEAGKFFGSINLSDIAAMGGTPLSFMAAFLIGDDMDEDYLEQFSSGLGKILSAYNTEYIGGDTKPGKSTSFAGFCIGTAKEGEITFRNRIGKNQILCMTNELGRVGSAYVNYINGVDVEQNGNEIVDINPRILEGQEIARSGGKFMMDMSDGLFGCLSQMKRDYGYGFRIVESELPFHESVEKTSERYGLSMTEIGCNIGGDYELLFTIQNEDYGKFSKTMEEKGIKVSYIGDVWEGDNLIFDGERWAKIEGKGWEYFK
ncbi:thiamine-phosphate kinase [Cuniculiplasma sp. SKW4]|uniref:thiamine-phosphate kinase n=1 Tax=Cuniculiplasma sp. SKW4 TaxID=3400171 RepID=UPI003FD148FC